MTIAQIEGRVRGAGSEFVLACDMRFAARESAIFGQFEPAFGLLPGGGAAQHLTRLMGRARALEVMLSAEDYDAELAERYGWINRALPADELGDFVSSLAHRIAGFPAAGHAVVKDRVNAIALAPVEDFRRDSDLFGEGVRDARGAEPDRRRDAARLADPRRGNGPGPAAGRRGRRSVRGGHGPGVGSRVPRSRPAGESSMSDHVLALLVADLVGAATLWKVTRAGARYPLVWSLGAWAATAAFSTGLIPMQTTVEIAGVTMIIGVGLITPLVGIIAVVVLLATPVIVVQRLCGRWWRAVAARASRA